MSCHSLDPKAVSLIKFPEYVKFTLALILHKYSSAAALDRVLLASSNTPTHTHTHCHHWEAQTPMSSTARWPSSRRRAETGEEEGEKYLGEVVK